MGKKKTKPQKPKDWLKINNWPDTLIIECVELLQSCKEWQQAISNLENKNIQITKVNLFLSLKQHKKRIPNKIVKIKEKLIKLYDKLSDKNGQIPPHLWPIEDQKITTAQKIKNQEDQQIKTLLRTLTIFKPEQTKRRVLTAKKAQHLEIEVSAESTVKRIKERYDRAWQDRFEQYLKNEFPYHEKHFFNEPSRPKLFYGTDEGQRTHVLAARYLQTNGEIDINNKLQISAFAETITKELAPNEKETWPEVSNYWLSNDPPHVGLQGERKDGLQNEDWQKTCHQLLANFEKNELEKVDFKNAFEGNVTTAKLREQFLHNFRVAQAGLNKNWKKDAKDSKKCRAYKHGLDIHKQNQNDIAAIYEDLICRRMCKWMLHAAHFNKIPVVYALDKVDLNAVAKGLRLKIVDTVSDGETRFKVPICTSELREIFRYIDKFDNVVQFYDAMQLVDPPWGESRTLPVKQSWAEYAMHLTRKLLLTYPGDAVCLIHAEKMITGWKNEDWSQVILEYKAMNPSLLRQPVEPTTNSSKKKYRERVFSEKGGKNEQNLVQAKQYIGEITDLLSKLHGITKNTTYSC